MTRQGSNKYFLLSTHEETSFKKQNQQDSTTESIKGNINFNIKYLNIFNVTSTIHYTT